MTRWTPQQVRGDTEVGVIYGYFNEGGILKFSNKIYFVIPLIFYAFLSHAQDDQSDDLVEYHLIEQGENLYKIAQLFDLGFDEILEANPNIKNPHAIKAGTKIILPTTHLIPDVKREGIAINLAELQLYFFADEGVKSFPISIGADEKTPTGKTKILTKNQHPSWIPPASIREENPKLPAIVPPGPENPLGDYALYLDASHNAKWQGIMIHGTNAPRSIGSKVSHGCIRLYPADIEKLFNEIEIGAPVTIVNQPIKVSRIKGKTYLEVHLKTAPDLVPENLGVKKLICEKVEDCEMEIDWQKVDDTVVQNLGIPINIDHRNSLEE